MRPSSTSADAPGPRARQVRVVQMTSTTPTTIKKITTNKMYSKINKRKGTRDQYLTSETIKATFLVQSFI